MLAAAMIIFVLAGITGWLAGTPRSTDADSSHGWGWPRAAATRLRERWVRAW